MGFRDFLGLTKGGASDEGEARGLLNALLEEFESAVREKKWDWSNKISGFDAAHRILDSDRQTQMAIFKLTLAQIVDQAKRGSTQWHTRLILKSLASALVRRNLGMPLSELVDCLEIMSKHSRYLWSDVPVLGFLGQCQDFIDSAGLPPELEKSLLQLRSVLAREVGYAEARKLTARIDQILGKMSEAGLDGGDVWADAALQYLESRDPASRALCDAILLHAASATGSKPSKTWLEKMRELVEAVGEDAFEARFIEWAALVGQPGVERPVRGALGIAPNRTILHERNAQALKGLVWAMAQRNNATAARALGCLAEECFKKIPAIGARCPKVGNACSVVLGMMSDPEAAAQLSRLQMKFKRPSTRRIVNKSLNQLATREGISPEELAERSVPTYGLSEDGVLRQAMGRWTAELRITGTHETTLTWIDPEGKNQQSVPAEVKSECADELKSLKRTVRDLQKMLPAQRDRLERLLTFDRHWTLAAWQDRYLNHPLLRHLCRRLIWQIDNTAAIWLRDRLVDVTGQPVTNLSPEMTIRLWHPMTVEPRTVLRWREQLGEHEITQPFKQAHREVYILTDAERQTEIYSNRFAGHIVKQHQFAALCQERGWRYHLQGNFDSSNTPVLELPQWDLRVEFWIETGGLGETSDSGIFVYASTDQVRFYRAGETEPMPLAEVPSRVFTEIMRDVDLFVGVASVSNDPTWSDGGPGGQYRDYWQRYSFGDLSASAATRKEVLQRLIPRLKIAPQCSFDEKFLVVKGSLRTYKIHLGSGNVLMLPNDQYLCIVPKQGEGERGKLHLPFEGDRTLSVIISKGFLLAADNKITDSSILSQLRR